MGAEECRARVFPESELEFQNFLRWSRKLIIMQVCESQAIVSVLFKASSIISNKLLATPFTTDCNTCLSGSQRKWCVRSRFSSPTLLILICPIWVAL